MDHGVPFNERPARPQITPAPIITSPLPTDSSHPNPEPTPEPPTPPPKSSSDTSNQGDTIIVVHKVPRSSDVDDMTLSQQKVSDGLEKSDTQNHDEDHNSNDIENMTEDNNSRKSKKMILILVALIVVVVVAILAGVLGSSSESSSSTTTRDVVPTEAPTIAPFPSSTPSYAPTTFRSRIEAILEPFAAPLDNETMDWLVETSSWEPNSDDQDYDYQWLERYAMALLYKTTDGPSSWSTSINWMSDAAACNWFSLVPNECPGPVTDLVLRKLLIRV